MLQPQGGRLSVFGSSSSLILFLYPLPTIPYVQYSRWPPTGKATHLRGPAQTPPSSCCLLAPARAKPLLSFASVHHFFFHLTYRTSHYNHLLSTRFLIYQFSDFKGRPSSLLSGISHGVSHRSVCRTEIQQKIIARHLYILK